MRSIVPIDPLTIIKVAFSEGPDVLSELSYSTVPSSASTQAKPKNASAVTIAASAKSQDHDIDPSVKALFVNPQHILRENRKPLSNFEQLNKTLLTSDFSAPITNIIGGQKTNTLMPKIDTRTEFRDRDGNYIDGKNRGKMKKRYEDEWQKRLELLDEEIQHATKVKRCWDALPEEEKARRRQKLEKNRSLCMLLGAGTSGAPASDIYTWEGVPEIYLQTTNPLLSSDSVHTNTPYTREGAVAENSFLGRFDDDASDLFPLSEPRSSSANKLVPQLTSQFSSKAKNMRSRKQNRRSAPSSSTIHGAKSNSKLRDIGAAKASRQEDLFIMSTPTNHASDATDTTPLLDPGPEVAAIEDLSHHGEFTDKDGAKEQFDRIRVASAKRGRLVSILLHEPVKYTSSAMVDRIFGGVVQEIQYFPAERMAIVCFVYPAEAAALVRHAKNIKESDRHGYRRLQIDIDWYHGLEIESVSIPCKCLFEHASTHVTGSSRSNSDPR